MSRRKIEGQQEAHQLALVCFVRNVGIDQFRKLQEREREAIADLGAGLDFQGCVAALRYLGVARKAPDLIAHANRLEDECRNALIAERTTNEVQTS
jgi:hypothetical protein